MPRRDSGSQLLWVVCFLPQPGWGLCSLAADCIKPLRDWCCVQATQKAHVGHLQVAEAVAVGTSGFAHPSSPTSPGKPAVHTSAPVWVTLWEGLFFAVPHLWGNLEKED